jgi:hypothetical protein
MKKAFEVQNPDFTLSPKTGMTKQHYIGMAKYLLERAFTHVKKYQRSDFVSGSTGENLPAARCSRLALAFA